MLDYYYYSCFNTPPPPYSVSLLLYLFLLLPSCFFHQSYIPRLHIYCVTLQMLFWGLCVGHVTWIVKRLWNNGCRHFWLFGFGLIVVNDFGILFCAYYFCQYCWGTPTFGIVLMIFFLFGCWKPTWMTFADQSLFHSFSFWTIQRSTFALQSSPWFMAICFVLRLHVKWSISVEEGTHKKLYSPKGQE